MASFLSNLFKGLTISAKWGINLLTKFIFPKKDFNPLTFTSGGILRMACILSGSILIPCFETMWPNNFPRVTPQKKIFGLRDSPYFRHLSNIFLKWVT